MSALDSSGTSLRGAKRLVPVRGPLSAAAVRTQPASSAPAFPHLICLLLAALVLAVCTLLVSAPAAHATAQAYAQLSGKYESSCDASYASHTAGAWGAYQFTSTSVRAHAEWLSDRPGEWGSWGDALEAALALDGGSCGWYFDATWRYISGGADATTGSAASDTMTNAKRMAKVRKKMKKLGFPVLSNGTRIATPNAKKALVFQYRYCLKAYYRPAVAAWRAVKGAFDINSYTVALRNVVFSTAIQHGVSGSAGIFSEACERNGGFRKIKKERKLIKAVYDERSRITKKAPQSTSVKIKRSSLSGTYLTWAKTYGLIGKYLAHFSKCSANVQVGVYVRLYKNEKADALAMYADAKK